MAGILGLPGHALSAPTPAAAAKTEPAAKPYEEACGAVGVGEARCLALRRTDIAAVPNGAAAPAAISGYHPADIQSAYSLPSSTAGTGMTVAIVVAYDLATAEADMAVYRAAFGLPACTSAGGCFTRIDQRGGTSYPATAVGTGWDAEIELDLDMISATCPNCSIVLVEADSNLISDLGAAANTAVGMGAIAVNNSYSAVEWAGQTLEEPLYNHAGVAVVASTGDYGYAGGPGFPASSRYVIAVGGTTLVTAANARGWSETAWAGGGSGCSVYETKPSWQADAGCVRRTLADIAAVADPATGVSVYDPNSGGWGVYGGTSVASPIIAAAYALAGGPAPGTYPGPSLYARSGSLWDVPSGANGTCGGSYLCTAGTGYDGPTGLGSPNGIAAMTAVPLTGATYIPLVPNRLVDSRAGTRLGLSASLAHNVPASFLVTERVPGDASRNVPATAVAVTGTLTAVNESFRGYYSLTPEAPVGAPETSTLNFPTGDTRANSLTIPLGSGGKLWVTYFGATGAHADVVFDVTGYFMPAPL